MRHRLAFSLVELLVVIAIISVLAALLLPSIQHAAFLARTSICGSNLRQVYSAIQAYELQFRNTPPGSRDIRVKCLGAAPIGPSGFGCLTWFGFVDSRDILSCPDTDYHPLAGQLNSTTGYAWECFRKPQALPMRGLQGYYSGSKFEPTVPFVFYYDYGTSCSYGYRRSAGMDAGYYTGNYISRVRRRMEELPPVFMACNQARDNLYQPVPYQHTHGGQGSTAVMPLGALRWNKFDYMRNAHYSYDYPYGTASQYVDLWGFLTAAMKK